MELKHSTDSCIMLIDFNFALDDAHIARTDEHEHHKYLHLVFQRFQSYLISINNFKFILGASSIEFLELRWRWRYSSATGQSEYYSCLSGTTIFQESPSFLGHHQPLFLIHTQLFSMTSKAKRAPQTVKKPLSKVSVLEHKHWRQSRPWFASRCLDCSHRYRNVAHS